MAQEIWDAYNAQGKKLGFDLIRGESIPEGVFHMVVEICTVTPTGQILLTQRDPKKPFGLQWEITGGSALKGESAPQAAARELREETGICIPPETLRPLYVYNIPAHHSTYYAYAAVVTSTAELITLQAGETVDFRWLTYEEFKCFAQTNAYSGPAHARLQKLTDALDHTLKEIQKANKAKEG